MNNTYSSAFVSKDYYIRRNADNQLQAVVKEMGRPAYISGPNQIGKTNLILNLIRELEKENYTCIYIDCSVGFESADEFFQYVLISIGKVINVRGDLNDSTCSPDTGHEAKLLRYLRTITGRIVICLDEVESLVQSEDSDRIFASIRSKYFNRIHDTELERLTYVFSGAFTASELIKNKNISPFNIGEKIYIDPFSLEEVTEIFLKHSLVLSKEVVERVFYWTNGHPKMISDVVTEIKLCKKQLNTANQIDLIIKKLYFSTHLRSPIDEIIMFIDNNSELHPVITNIIDGCLEDINYTDLSKLHLAGIVILDSKHRPTIVNPVIKKAISSIALGFNSFSGGHKKNKIFKKVRSFIDLWEFIRDEKNQKALTLVGCAVAAIVTSFWALWQYYHPKGETQKTAPLVIDASKSMPVTTHDSGSHSIAPGPVISGEQGNSGDPMPNSIVNLKEGSVRK